MEKKKIILFGGTFNPIHNGHLIVARNVAEQLDIKRLMFIPNGNPPHKENKVSSFLKYDMVKAALERHDEWLFDLGDYEITRSEKSYTIDTVRHYKRMSGDVIDKPYWLIGPDNLANLHEWHMIDELVEECIFIFATSNKNDMSIISSTAPGSEWYKIPAFEKHEPTGI